MTASLLKNFNSMASLMPFLRERLRQTMIRKLAIVGKDKEGWKKADEHLTTLILRTFHLSLLLSNETCAVTLGARTYRTSKRVQDKGYHTKRQQESEVNLNHNMLAPQVPLLCPERRGASRYLSSGYMLGPCESAKEEEKEV